MSTKVFTFYSTVCYGLSPKGGQVVKKSGGQATYCVAGPKGEPNRPYALCT